MHTVVLTSINEASVLIGNRMTPAILDTGSCEFVASIHASTSVSIPNTTHNVQYVDGSNYVGTYYRDTVSISSIPSYSRSDFQYLYAHDITGTDSNTTGVLGLCQNNVNTFMTDNVFAFEFDHSGPNNSTVNGTFMVGTRAELTEYQKETQWLSLKWFSWQYPIKWEQFATSFTSGDWSLPAISAFKLVNVEFDTGTVTPILPYDMAQQLADQLGLKSNSLLDSNSALKWDEYPCACDAIFPPVTIRIGAELKITIPSSKLIRKSGNKCLYLFQGLSSAKRIILGTEFLRDFRTIFDPINHQIGLVSLSDINVDRDNIPWEWIAIGGAIFGINLIVVIVIVLNVAKYLIRRNNKVDVVIFESSKISEVIV